MTEQYYKVLKIKLICSGCGNDVVRSVGSMRENQCNVYCNKNCRRKTNEEKLISKRRCNRIWSENNKEKIKLANKEWRELNKDRIKAKKREDYHKNKKELNERARQKRLENPVKTKQRNKDYYNKNRDRLTKVQKEFRDNNPEKVKAYREYYRKNNRYSTIWSRSKKSAKDQGVEFNLTREWIKERIDNGFCEMSGIKFDMEGKRTPNSPSVDRKIPEGPYTQENCRIILWSINRALCNYGEEYLLDVFSKILDKR